MIDKLQFLYSLRYILILFLVGVFGLFATRKNMIIVLMSIEIMLLASIYGFVFLSLYSNQIIAQLFAIFILTVAAAESAIGLALIVLYYRHKAIISVDEISYLKG